MQHPLVNQLVPVILLLGIIGYAAYFMSRNRVSSPGGQLIVRCREGHLFTTIWIPFVSFKAIRLGPFRYQYCPAGQHWSLVTPVDPASLSDSEYQAAINTRDSNTP